MPRKVKHCIGSGSGVIRYQLCDKQAIFFSPLRAPTRKIRVYILSRWFCTPKREYILAATKVLVDNEIEPCRTIVDNAGDRISIEVRWRVFIGVL